MASATTPDGIVYPDASDPIAPLNAVFQDLAESVQSALDVRPPGGNDLEDLGDVDITTATTGDTLVYDGSDWTNQPITTRRNLLYNGAMQVHQRGVSSTGITGAGYYTADRWDVDLSGLGTWTQSIEADGPTGSGFAKSLKLLCTTADSTPAAGDYFFFTQKLEGQDLRAVKKGTANAENLSLSFWVKSNVTGTYIAELFDLDNLRQVSASYTISASGTWEKKSITFPKDTSGLFDNDNALSLFVNFGLGAGTDRTSGTLNTVWAANNNANRYVGQTNLAAATNNYWQITGVQLEVGPVATPFEFKPFGQELLECQRYYYRMNADAAFSYFAIGSGSGSTNASIFAQHPTRMRVGPSSVEFSTLGIADFVNSPLAVTSVTIAHKGFLGTAINASVASGATTFRPYALLANNNTNAFLAFSAEL
jgi:hypothetical protein